MTGRTEAGEQETVIEYCELMRIPAVHIANEAKRSKAYGAQMKRMGLRKGFPDLFIPAARRGFHGLFIELKRDKQSKVSKAQREWIEYLNGAGYLAAICYGAEEAIAEISGYFGVKT